MYVIVYGLYTTLYVVYNEKMKHEIVVQLLCNWFCVFSDKIDQILPGLTFIVRTRLDFTELLIILLSWNVVYFDWQWYLIEIRSIYWLLIFDQTVVCNCMFLRELYRGLSPWATLFSNKIWAFPCLSFLDDVNTYCCNKAHTNHFVHRPRFQSLTNKETIFLPGWCWLWSTVDCILRRVNATELRDSHKIYICLQI